MKMHHKYGSMQFCSFKNTFFSETTKNIGQNEFFRLFPKRHIHLHNIKPARVQIVRVGPDKKLLQAFV
jgi:hypothetical protein